VALTPEGLAQVGTTGFVSGGIPGAIAAVAGAAVANFAAAASSGRVVDFPSGHPKEPLQAPYWQVMTQFQGALGKIATEQRLAKLDPQERARRRNDASVWGRAGGAVITQIFREATVEQIKSIIALSSESVAATRIRLEGGPDPASQEEEAMVFGRSIRNPVTGVDQPPERVDRGRYNEGLGNELVSQPVAKALAPSIVPVIDIARYLPAEEIVGTSVAFRQEVVINAVVSVTMLRIPVRADKNIFIRSGTITITPSAIGLIPTYRAQGTAVDPTTNTPTKKMHWISLRRTASQSLAGSLLDLVFGQFAVPRGLEYIIRIENSVGAQITAGCAVEAVYIPIGLEGGKC